MVSETDPNQKPESGTKTVGVRVPHEMYDEMVEAAAADQRSVSSYLLSLINRDLKMRNQLIHQELDLTTIVHKVADEVIRYRKTTENQQQK